ncbi:MAG: hypothetical protein JNK63_09405 [Chthonomonas sp.]|nr:hypothetical protein [Chthonomonas sp.]
MITLLDQQIDHAMKLFSNDQRQKGLELMQKIVDENPQKANAVHGLAMMMLNMDRPEEAKPFLEKSIELEPNNPVYYCNFGAFWTRINEHEKSLEYLFKAIELKDDYTDVMLNIGHVMSMLGRFDEAIEWASKAHAIVPGDEQLTMNLYTYLRDQDFEKGFKFLREKLERYDRPHFWRVVCSDSLYSDQISEEEVDRLHFTLGEKVAGIPPTKRYLSKADPDRKIRIGFLSSDLRRHSVSFFLLDWLRQLDKDKFEVYLYLAMGAPDDITELYKEVGHVELAMVSKIQSLVNLIYNDKIDILYDLNGLTIGGRPDVLAVKPAPIQVSAIGYAHSLGLNRIDYRLADSITDPEGSEVHYAEKLVRIEGCFLNYGILDPLPDIEETPDRPVIFGSFNNHLKINRTTVKLWADVIKANPGSILLLKALGLRHPPIRKAVMGWFEAEGIRDELRILEPQDVVVDHQAMYREIDIALDTFPYNGTTTTMEALLMGVPVVTLQGDVHRGRVSSSLLINAGLPEYVAHSPKEFVEIASRAAKDIKAIRNGKQALRDKIKSSSLMDSKGYAKKMATFMEKAWRDYCASQA